MSEIRDIMEHYREVRQRLRYPPNAVADTEINLRPVRVAVEVPLKILEPAPPLSEPTPSVTLRHPLYAPFVPTSLTFSSTIEISASEFGLTSEQLRRKGKKCRARAVCVPRQIAIYVAAKQGRWAASWIANRLDLDHTTILHAIKKIGTLIETNLTLKSRVESIEAAIAAPANSQSHLGEGPERDVQIKTVPALDRTSRSTFRVEQAKRSCRNAKGMFCRGTGTSYGR